MVNGPIQNDYVPSIAYSLPFARHQPLNDPKADHWNLALWNLSWIILPKSRCNWVPIPPTQGKTMILAQQRKTLFWCLSQSSLCTPTPPTCRRRILTKSAQLPAVFSHWPVFAPLGWCHPDGGSGGHGGWGRPPERPASWSSEWRWAPGGCPPSADAATHPASAACLATKSSTASPNVHLTLVIACGLTRWSPITHNLFLQMLWLHKQMYQTLLQTDGPRCTCWWRFYPCINPFSFLNTVSLSDINMQVQTTLIKW